MRLDSNATYYTYIPRIISLMYYILHNTSCTACCALALGLSFTLCRTKERVIPLAEFRRCVVQLKRACLYVMHATSLECSVADCSRTGNLSAGTFTGFSYGKVKSARQPLPTYHRSIKSVGIAFAILIDSRPADRS